MTRLAAESGGGAALTDPPVVSRREVWVVSTLFATTLLVYSACIVLNYYLEDEQWIMNVAQAPDATLVLGQGRPVFVLFIWLTGWLRNTAGAHTMVILRLCAILCLAGAGWIFTRWFRRCNCSTVESTALAVAVITLPGFQIFIANAVWFTVPLLLVASLPLLIWRLSETGGPRRLAGMAAATASALIVLSFYQPTFLILLGLSVLPVALIDPRDQPLARRRLRYAMTTIVGAAICTLVYYVAWRALYVHYLPNSVDTRYSPLAMVSGVSDRVWFFMSERLQQALNLWTLDTGRIRVSGVLVLAAIIAGFMVDVARCRSAARLRESAGTVSWVALKYGTLVALVLGADAIPLLSRYPIRSYSTVPALSLALFLWAVGATLSTLEEVRRRDWGTVSLSALAVYGACVAMYTVTVYIAWPLHLEYELVANDVRSYLAVNPGPVHRIHVIGRPDKLYRTGPQEYGWSNFMVDAYAVGLLRNVLRDLNTNAAAGFRRNSDYWDLIPATHSGPFDATTEFQRAMPRSGDVLVVDTRRYPSEHGEPSALERHNSRYDGRWRGRIDGHVSQQADGAVEVGTSGFVLYGDRIADEDLPLNVYTWPFDLTEANLNRRLRPVTDGVQWRPARADDIVTALRPGRVTVDGVTQAPSSYLLKWPSERLQIGTYLIVRGRLAEGGMQIGLLCRDKWVGTVMQADRGAFLIILEVQRTDDYQLVLANWIPESAQSNGQGINRFVISNAGWMSAD